jgi:hypothetical protein
MIPLELLSMGISTLLGGIMSIMAQKSQDRASEHKMLMQRAELAASQTDKAREVKDPHTMHTRRWIAVMIVFSVVVLPKLAPFIDPNMLIYVGYTEVISQGWWIFSSDYDMTQWKPMTGLVITPLDTHLASAVVGMYFGIAATRRR